MDYVSEIKNRLSMPELVKRMGFDMTASGMIKSIYKEEKTPSLKIYDSYFVDFSQSGDKKGDVIQFYQDYYRCDFPTALKELCGICGISYSGSDHVSTNHYKGPRKIAFNKVLNRAIPECLSEDEKDFYFTSMGKTFDYADDYEVEDGSELHKKILDYEKRVIKYLRAMRFQNNINILSSFVEYLWKIGLSDDVRDYLIEERKLPLEVLNKFMICSVNNYFETSGHFKKAFALGDLQRAGLFNEKGNFIFNKHKIIIPYLWKGWVAYVRGRYFAEGSSESNGAKYIGLCNDALGVNSPKRFFNSDVFLKSLPGEKIYIVEGEFDTIALTSLGYKVFGIPGVGNLPSEKWLKKLVDYDVVVCVDTDDAGKKLTEKLIELFNGYKKEIKIKELPNKDINEFIKNG
uniref:Putative DNA topoisomerase-primase n=1 Tax=viral metagenome TaxID=1070528 RepID=A0A6M3KEJ5_9ZZZZ